MSYMIELNSSSTAITGFVSGEGQSPTGTVTLKKAGDTAFSATATIGNNGSFSFTVPTTPGTYNVSYSDSQSVTATSAPYVLMALPEVSFDEALGNGTYALINGGDGIDALALAVDLSGGKVVDGGPITTDLPQDAVAAFAIKTGVPGGTFTTVYTVAKFADGHFGLSNATGNKEVDLVNVEMLRLYGGAEPVEVNLVVDEFQSVEGKTIITGTPFNDTVDIPSIPQNLEGAKFNAAKTQLVLADGVTKVADISYNENTGVTTIVPPASTETIQIKNVETLVLHGTGTSSVTIDLTTGTVVGGSTVPQDTTPPTLSFVGPVAGSYHAGDILNFTFTFSEPMQSGVTPPPLVIKIGTGADISLNATLQAPTGQNAGPSLVYSYTLQSADTGNISIVSHGTQANALPKDLAGNTLAPGSLPVLSGVTAAAVTTPPSDPAPDANSAHIQNIWTDVDGFVLMPESTGNQLVHGTITVGVNFSSPVSWTVGHEPTFAIKVGTHTYQAVLDTSSNSSGGNELQFVYQFKQGDTGGAVSLIGLQQQTGYALKSYGYENGGTSVTHTANVGIGTMGNVAGKFVYDAITPLSTANISGSNLVLGAHQLSELTDLNGLQAAAYSGDYTMVAVQFTGKVSLDTHKTNNVYDGLTITVDGTSVGTMTFATTGTGVNAVTTYTVTPGGGNPITLNSGIERIAFVGANDTGGMVNLKAVAIAESMRSADIAILGTPLVESFDARLDYVSTDNVSMEGGPGGDTLFGHDGVNFINGGGGTDTIDARGGDDRILFSKGADIIDGGAGLDALELEFNNEWNTVQGTVANGHLTLASTHWSYDLSKNATTGKIDVIQSSRSTDAGNYTATGNTATLSNVEKVDGQNSSYYFAPTYEAAWNTLEGSIFDDQININTALSGTTTGNWVNVKGGAGADTITLSALLSGKHLSVQGGYGSDVDTLVLSNLSGLTKVVDAQATQTNYGSVRYIDSANKTVLSLMKSASSISIHYTDPSVPEGSYNSSSGADFMEFERLQLGNAPVEDLTLAGFWVDPNGGSAGTGTASTSTEDTVTHLKQWAVKNFGTSAVPERLEGSNDGHGAVDFGATTTGKVTVDLFKTISSQDTGFGVKQLVNIDKVLGGLAGDEIKGNGYDNTVDARDGNDFLDGGRGNDTLLGGAGNDTILGGLGNDWLEGGAGVDTLTGGIGADKFVFRETGSANADTITDFVGIADRIYLDHTAFGGLTATSPTTGTPLKIDATHFTTTDPSGANQAVHYNQATGNLSYWNGTEEHLFATLSNKAALSANNFYVI